MPQARSGTWWSLLSLCSSGTSYPFCPRSLLLLCSGTCNPRICWGLPKLVGTGGKCCVILFYRDSKSYFTKSSTVIGTAFFQMYWKYFTLNNYNLKIQVPCGWQSLMEGAMPSHWYHHLEEGASFFAPLRQSLEGSVHAAVSDREQLAAQACGLSYHHEGSWWPRHYLPAVLWQSHPQWQRRHHAQSVVGRHRQGELCKV